jgi:hypothetical protein
MMQTADFGHLQDPARLGELDGPDVGGVCDQGTNLGIDGWPAGDGPIGELGPVLAEATPLPA